MKLAIMQPYLFPYIGYWQLLNAADKFVALDDVAFIKRGHINRNRILINGAAYLFTVPVQSASQNRLIMDTKLRFDEKERAKFLLRIENSYRRAGQFGAVMPFLEKIIWRQTEDLTELILFSLQEVMAYLGIKTELLRSSEIDKDPSLKAQDRILEICRRLDADTYINPSGGRALYQSEAFARQGMKLFFLDTRFDKVKYRQFQEEFVENLSILDILMFNEVEQIKRFLEEYDLNG